MVNLSEGNDNLLSRTLCDETATIEVSWAHGTMQTNEEGASRVFHTWRI